MAQKDYLMRQIEMIGPMIMYMLGIWKDGRVRDALDYGAENLENLTDLDLSELDIIHEDQIVQVLTQEKEMVPGMIRIVAEFLYRIGEIRHKEGHPNGRETLLKSRNLLLWHEEATSVFSLEVESIKAGIEDMLTG